MGMVKHSCSQFFEAGVLQMDKNNYLFQSGSSTSLSIGGGSHFALWIDEALQNGTSGFCETFNSQRLSSEASFRIRAVECVGICS